MITPREARALLDEREGFTVDAETGCWIWSGELPASGLGPYLAFYEAVYGPPPEGFDVYHVCPGRLGGCVNPDHLDIAPAGARVKLAAAPPLAYELRTSFAAKIRDEREARRMTVVEFARELGVNKHTLTHWERGERVPGSDRFQQLARQLGWDQQARRWIVTFVHEEVVVASSAGAAMREAWDGVERPGRRRKTAVYNVRPASK